MNIETEKFANADKAEIAKFDAMAHEWWNPAGSCAPLHQLNPLRLAFIQQHGVLKDQRILDVGCGGGILAESLARLGADVTGIDLSEKAILAAREHAEIQKNKGENLQLKYFLTSVDALAKECPEYFDVITCMEMLEHVPNPQAIIQACSQLLKPDGKIFFSTINRNIKSYAFAILGAEWLLKLLPIGTHDFAKFIRPSELSAMAREAGIQFGDLRGITYSPFSKRYALSADVSVNYLAYGHKGEYAD